MAVRGRCGTDDTRHAASTGTTDAAVDDGREAGLGEGVWEGGARTVDDGVGCGVWGA
jgi:hypothetical protein